MATLLELQDLYNESLVKEVLEKTKRGGLTWSHLGGTQFQATYINTTPDPDVTWDYFVTKTQIGNLSYRYTFDVKKDAVAYISIQDGSLPNTGRDSSVKGLYEAVEIIVLQLDEKIKETLQAVQGITIS